MKLIKFGLLLLAFCLVLPAWGVQPGAKAPPDRKMIDSFGVNIITGQVEQRLETVAIGGERGLSHSITAYANHFDAASGYGYIDKFRGGLWAKRLADKPGEYSVDQNGVLTFSLIVNPSPLDTEYTDVIRAFGPAGSQDFAFKVGNEYLNTATDSTPGLTYEPIGDKRHSLSRVKIGTDNHWLWTNPDGVETRFINGTIKSITYPTGLVINIDSGAVWTNTGYMLKYDNPVQYNMNGYYGSNPKSVTGINLAHQYCSPNVSSPVSGCNIQNWPTAWFNWPTGSPGTFYTVTTNAKVFSVTDQFGGITEFHYRAQNICLWQIADASGESSHCLNKNNGSGSNGKYQPRLMGVKTSGSDVLDYEYTYENQGDLKTNTSGDYGSVGLGTSSYYWDLSTKEGRVSSARNKNRTSVYGEVFDLGQDAARFARDSQGNRVESFSYVPGVLDTMQVRRQGLFSFEENARNFVDSFDPIGPEPVISYLYDSRGNLYQVWQNGQLIQELQYPSVCSNPKFCNKPTWIKDAKGQQTDFTYHPESGQVATVTGPAVKVNGGASVRPKTYYKYEQKYAYFKNQSGSLVSATTPLWLLTEEHTCRTSSATSTGCSAGDMDMVKTEYYYGEPNTPNNLHLLGKSITAAGNASDTTPQTRVWCYAYDALGNMISETPPKANTGFQSCQ